MGNQVRHDVVRTEAGEMAWRPREGLSSLITALKGGDSLGASTLWPGDKGQGVCRNWVQKHGGLAGTVQLGYGKGAQLRHRLRAS